MATIDTDVKNGYTMAAAEDGGEETSVQKRRCNARTKQDVERAGTQSDKWVCYLYILHDSTPP